MCQFVMNPLSKELLGTSNLNVFNITIFHCVIYYVLFRIGLSLCFTLSLLFITVFFCRAQVRFSSISSFLVGSAM